MQNYSKKEMLYDQELIEILMEFVIITATMVKKVSRAIRAKILKEGEDTNEQNRETKNVNRRVA